jgi:hypothetical protein
MKITVQNGSAHGLSRREVESIVPLLPSSWSRFVAQITLYQGTTSALKVEFYQKEKTLGLFWPTPLDSISKSQGLEELLLALSVISERGNFPSRLASSARTRHLEKIAPILSQQLLRPNMRFNPDGFAAG